MNRSTAKYICLLAVFTGLFYWKTLLTGQFTLLNGTEVVDYTYSWLRFWIHSLRQGHIPLWDPYAFCGRPFAAEMLPSAFYPLHLPLLLIPFDRNGLLPQSTFHQLFALTHFVGACFTFALIRELRLSRFAAFVGACSFNMCNMLANLVWLPFQEACIWLPAIFLFLLRALRAEKTRNAILQAALSGLCLGMSILTGGLHFSIMQGIIVVSALIYYGASSHAQLSLHRHALSMRIFLILAVILAVGGGTGAVQLLPSYEYGGLSMRFIDGGAFPSAQKIPYHRLHPGLWPQSILSTLFPAGFDQKYGGGEIWGIYVGVLPFLLAIAGIWKSWGQLWVRYLTGVAVLAFFYSLGEFSPLHGALYAVVPFLWVVRTVSRFVYLASFALAILAAFGLDSLLDKAKQDGSWSPANCILKWIALASAAALFVPGIYGQLNLGIWNSLSLLLILVSCGLFSYLAAHNAGRWVRLLIAGFILFDLSAFHLTEINKSAPSKPTDQLDKIISLRGVAEFLKARPDLGRVRVAVAAEPNIGDAYGVQSVWGGGGTLLTAYSRLLPQHEDLLNVRYTVKPASVADPAPVYQDANWKVYENPGAYPRAWLVHKTVVEASHEAVFGRLLDPAINLRNVALLEAPLRHALVEDGAGRVETVRFRSYEPDRMRLDVSAESAGLLVLSELHYPGWRATVNGKSSEIHRVDGALRGISISRGQSRIELEYAPFSLYAGGVLSLLTVFGVLSALALTWLASRSGLPVCVDDRQGRDAAHASQI